MTSPMIEAYEAQHGIKWDDTARSVRACWHDAWCLAVEYKDAENAKLRDQRDRLIEVVNSAIKFNYLPPFSDPSLLSKARAILAEIEGEMK